MRSGAIVQQGSAEELYLRPNDIFVARFFCDFNEVEGVVRNGHVSTALGVFAAPGLAEGATAVVCVRPQGIRLRPAGFCLPGRLLARRFLGEVDLVHVAVQGLDRPLQARIRHGGASVVGQDVGVEIDPHEVLVFAASHP
jgi:iron(III) transport system ATP-binding protein